ncbi:MAG: thioesterase [Clostridia bacterium]|nr:thioesterase [Clostridia bacterium]
MFTTDFTVRYNEIGPDRLATAATILTYLQDTAIEHSEAIGFGLDRLIELHKAWILLWWRVRVLRYPHYGEKVYSTTWPSKFVGVTGKREFTIRDIKGSPIVRADSMWAMYNTAKARLCAVGKEIAAAYRAENVRVFDTEYEEITLPRDLEKRDSFHVRKHDIDTNSHVNNVRYLDYAIEQYGEFEQPSEFTVRYKKMARPDDLIFPFVLKQDNVFFCRLAAVDGADFAVIALNFDKMYVIQ